MTLQECYALMGADYNDVLGRLRSERLIQKFVLKFLDDGNFELLCRSMEQEEWDLAFQASHTLKGMSQNLSFTRLGLSSHELTEALRARNIPEASRLLEQVKNDYQETSDAICAFRAELS